MGGAMSQVLAVAFDGLLRNMPQLHAPLRPWVVGGREEQTTHFSARGASGVHVCMCVVCEC